MSPTSVILALTVVIATLSVPSVDSYLTYYYYYYYPYYYTVPSQCTETYYPSVRSCPLSSCYYSQTYNTCCLRYFTYNSVLYKQCICTPATICAPTNDAIDNPQPQIAPPTTTATTPTTTTSTTTPTTTTSTTTPTTTTTTTTTTTPTTTTTTPTTTTTTTTPTTTSTTTPTTTSTTTPKTTSTTTPKTTSTTTPKTTSTTTPKTTSTTTPTTTSTTTPTTTTPAFRSLCDSGFRLLNGEATSNCDFNGIANITLYDGILQTCNAVYAPATVNGVYKPTFITASVCKSFIEAAEAEDGTISEIQIGSQRYPIDPPLFNVVDGPNGLAYIDINSRYSNLLVDLGCQKAACPYNQDTMEGKVDFNDCKIISWGVIAADSLTLGGLHEAKISLNLNGCAGISDTFGAANTLCFKTTSGANLICARDSGSPVYCKAPSNGEWILVGVSALQNKCNDSPEVKVIPYSG